MDQQTIVSMTRSELQELIKSAIIRRSDIALIVRREMRAVINILIENSRDHVEDYDWSTFETFGFHEASNMSDLQESELSGTNTKPFTLADHEP